MYYSKWPPDQPTPNQQQPAQPQIVALPTEVLIEQVMANVRNIHAMARINESIILLNGMAEIRMALNIPSVADGDIGSSERVPLKPMFEQDQIAQLQAAYLSLSERYHKFTLHTMRELKIGKQEEPKQE